MRDRPDRGDTLGSHHGALRIRPLEARLHPAVLEKEPRLIVNDVLPNIKERELRGFHNVGTNRPKGKLLDIAGVHMRQMRPAIRKTIPVNARSAVSQDERIGLWVTDKGQALEI